MAAKITTKQESLLKCPTCMADLTEPRAFQCSHLFCQSCVDDMKPKDGEPTPCYECPVCQKFTAKDKIQPMQCINELLKVVTSAENEQILCDKCKSKTPVWRCRECKENFCTACYDGHNEYSFLKHHKWDKLSGDIKAVLDKHVYCPHPDHSEELVKLHCKDCMQLICFLCNGTEHKTHEAETIKQAVEKLLPTIKENIAKAEEIIKKNGKLLEETTVQGEEIKKTYEDVEKEIDSKWEEIIRKAREDCKQVKQQLQTEKNEEFSKIETFRKQLEVNIQSQRNIVALSDTTLTTAQGTSLLQMLQSGVGDNLDASIKGGVKSVDRPSVRFTKAPVPKENLIGAISKESTEGYTKSDFINRSLTDMSQMSATLAIEIKPVVECPKFVKIGNELWFLRRNRNNIDVYSLSGNKLRSVQYEQVGNCQSVTTLQSGLVLAATNGLYLADLHGGIKYKVMDGDISDVSVMNNMLYVLDNGASKIHVCKLNEDGKSHTTQMKFQILNYNKTSFNTVQVTRENIYVALYSTHRIVQYGHDGILKATYTSCNATIGQKLSYAILCGVDAAGSLLVVRQAGNHRVVILTSDGQWQSLPVTGLSGTYGAFVEDDKLWVYDYTYSACKQYIFK